MWQIFVSFRANTIGEIIFNSLCSWSNRVKGDESMFPTGVHTRQWGSRGVTPLGVAKGSPWVSAVTCTQHSHNWGAASTFPWVSTNQQRKSVQTWGKEHPTKCWAHVFPCWISWVESGKWLGLSELVFSKIAFVEEQWNILSRTRIKDGLIQPWITWSNRIRPYLYIKCFEVYNFTIINYKTEKYVENPLVT